MSEIFGSFPKPLEASIKISEQLAIVSIFFSWFTIKGESKKTSLSEFCFWNHSLWKEIAHSKTYMTDSSQLAIIQAFTALWTITFEQMVVILNFVQRRSKNIKFIMYVSNAPLNLKKQMIIPVYEVWNNGLWKTK